MDAPDRDVTPEFFGLYEAAKQRRLSLPAEADRFVYLCVPGFMARHFGHGMKPNLAALRDLGLDARLSELDSGAAVAPNARFLARSIVEIAKTAGKKVIPIVHSSGAPELHHALVEHPELKAVLRGVISLSGTWRGTPIAPFFVRSRWVFRALQWLGARMGFDPQGIADVGVERRREFCQSHPYPADVPTLFVACSATGGFSLMQPLVWLLRGSSPGGQSDGLVPTAHQSAGGHDVVHLAPAQHADTIAVRRFSRQDPVALTRAAVTWLLTRSARP